jgi:hypothetical protein
MKRWHEEHGHDDPRGVAAPSPSMNATEVVERKGLGHPDTICDHLQ